ncbi:unnamed protein product [Dicrocoelium dendriticum]|nr:unnamed protein product [Dicrocoelium dendriticum]
MIFWGRWRRGTSRFFFLLYIFQMYNVWEYEDVSSSPYWTRVMMISLWVVPSVLGKIVPQSNPRSPRCPGPQRKGKVGDNREKTARTGMELNIVSVLCYNIWAGDKSMYTVQQ